MFTISTPRLQLRKIRLSDADFMLELWNSSGWKKYIGDRGLKSTIEATEFLKSQVLPTYSKFGFGFYIIEIRASRIRVGICGLIRRIGLEDVDIGYALLPTFEGHGYALESAQATLDYGKMVHALSRIVAITPRNNERSIILLKKLGMVYEKMVKLPGDDEELMLFSNNPEK